MIDLDHHSTPPIPPEAMMPSLSPGWGNPNPRRFGAELKTVLETARERVADRL